MFQKNFPPYRFVATHLLLCIVILALGLRLYKITSPPLDWHAFRQADTASVTREFVKHGINLFVPRYHDLSNIQSGEDNLNGYRMVEFPLLNAITAFVVKYANVPLDTTSRLVSVIFSLGSLLSLYYLVRELSGKKTALLTAFIFAVLPFSIFYSRAILPEAGMLFFSLLTFLSFHMWVKTRTAYWYLLSIATFSLALLMKPFVIFLAPVLLTITWFTRGKNSWKEWSLPLMGLISIIPFFAWREWIERYPSGIPANDWLFNGNGIRFRPAWFRWLFWERITKIICGYACIVFFPFNFFDRRKDIVVYGSWWLGIIAYFSVIASGNVQHDYYQVLAVPIICISIARGAVVAWSMLKKHFSKTWATVIVAGVLALGLCISWKQFIGPYYNINHWEYITAGKVVDEKTPADARVIAPAFGDTQFLYQTNRTGWPIGFEIEKKISLGAQYYVSTSYDDEARELEQQYEVIEKTSSYIFIDLQKKR